jgi:general secretion pathway protein I
MKILSENVKMNNIQKILLPQLKKQLGFTLLEVMLAMAVFAVAGVALMSAAGSNARNLSQLEQQMFAQWVASNQLVNASIDSTWPPKNNKSGSEKMAGREWSWQMKVLKTADKNMRAIEVEVRLDDGQEQSKPLASFITYVAKGEK